MWLAVRSMRVRGEWGGNGTNTTKESVAGCGCSRAIEGRGTYQGRIKERRCGCVKD